MTKKQSDELAAKIETVLDSHSIPSVDSRGNRYDTTHRVGLLDSEFTAIKRALRNMLQEEHLVQTANRSVAQEIAEIYNPNPPIDVHGLRYKANEILDGGILVSELFGNSLGETLAPAPTATHDDVGNDLHEDAAEKFELTRDQKRAWKKLTAWCADKDSPYFVLKGYAGTGKTYLMQLLQELPYTFHITAPTNKASKVIAKVMGTEPKTIYSLLGLKMSYDDDKLVLKYPDENKLPYFRAGAIVVIDEAGFSNKDLLKFLAETVVRCKIKVLLVGDPIQLPPVGEIKSRAWRLVKKDDRKNRSMLREIKRFDNQILTASEALRNCVIEKTWQSPLVDDHDKKGGVRLVNQRKFDRMIVTDITPETFVKTKVIAWRNKTVDRYNSMIRKALGFTTQYAVGDVLLIDGLVNIDDQIVANTDDEGVVLSVVSDKPYKYKDYELPVHRILLDMGDQRLNLMIPHDESPILDSLLSQLANRARSGKINAVERRERWKEFWDLRNLFHGVRYGYALTAHRAQGSTFHTVYVDQMDILANSDKETAFRCFYVACTRCTTWLISY